MKAEEIRLSLLERTYLANQYEILKRLDSDSADYYEGLVEVLRSGYELEYYRALLRVDAPLSSAECNYVRDVLEMYGTLQGSAKRVGLEDDRLDFPGFDGNNEDAHLAYAQHLRKRELWDYVKARANNLNSHMRTRSKYQAMLTVFQPLWRKALDSGSLESLSQEEVLAVLDAPFSRR